MKARHLPIIFSAGAFLALSSSPAQAQLPCPFSQVFGTVFGEPITQCRDDRPVAGFVYGIGSGASSGTANVVCEAEGEDGQGHTGCFGAGVAGDGLVSVDGNWGNTGVIGCPNPAGLPGVGRNVFVVRDPYNRSVVFSAGYDVNVGGYVAEYAFHADTFTLSCVAQEGFRAASLALQLLAISSTGDTVNTTSTVQVRAVAPRVFSDCDPTSLGQVFNTGTCPEGALAVAPGSVYYRVDDCLGTAPDLRRGAWTPAPTAADGTSTFTAVHPSDRCLMVGATAVFEGEESPAVVSTATIGGLLFATPRALDVRARKIGGEVLVEFHTLSEIGLIVLEVETPGGRRLGTISPRGSDGLGAGYSAKFGRGEFRHERELQVVAVTASGRTKSDVASFE